MSTDNTAKRIEYGFKLEFPNKPFTVKLLTTKGAKPSYITAYKRVQKALAENIIEVVGEAIPKMKRRGAREKIYARINAKTAIVNLSPVVAEVVADGNPF
jgi:hypothetical protein